MGKGNVLPFICLSYKLLSAEAFTNDHESLVCTPGSASQAATNAVEKIE